MTDRLTKNHGDEERLKEKFSSLYQESLVLIDKKINELKSETPEDTGLFPVEFVKIYLSPVNDASVSLLSYEKKGFDPLGEILPQDYWLAFKEWLLPHASQIFIEQFNLALDLLNSKKPLSSSSKQALEQTYNQYIGRFGKRIQNDINKASMENQNNCTTPQSKTKSEETLPPRLLQNKEQFPEANKKNKILKTPQRKTTLEEDVNQQKFDGDHSDKNTPEEFQNKNNLYIGLAIIAIISIVFILFILI